MSLSQPGPGTVLVTGAAGGIGAAVATALAPGAAVLALWDRDPRVREVAAALTAAPPHRASARPLITAAEVDVADPDAVATAFDALTAAHGAPDVVVHAAGVHNGESALEVTAAAWQHTLAVNASGTMHVAQRAARAMVTAGRGALVVVTSNSAATPRVGMAAYGAAKAAAAAYTKALALQVAPHGVRVNLVSPGSTDTAMLRGMLADGAPPLDDTARRGLLDGDPDAYRLGIPLRRIADPGDIAAAVRFLVSDDARHITMHDLRVDGGATLDM
ncbi:SDR family oxidoreductase [Nocardia jiangsuensis]|uniref:SDR family oxidoreductase n=1 Tax=Nocardia jiangsuensis TaxID=1691563 RepID=A0ABV8DZW2_9NOCA